MGKSVKKTVSLLLAMAMVLSFAGCKDGSGQTGNTSSEKINKTGETITLRVLENDTAKKEGYFDELLKAFNEAYAGEGIVAVDADMDEYSDLAQNGPYGYGPDVLYQANDVLMRYAEDKHILPLEVEQYDSYQYVPEAAWDAFKISVDGKTYICGMPVNIQEPMFFYVKERLPENWETEYDRNSNGTPDFFENWNDLYAYSKYLRDNDTSANKDSQYGFMTSFNDLYMNGEFFFSYGAYVFEKNADGLFEKDKIGLNKGNAVNGMTALMQFAKLMNEGCIDDTITSNRYEKLANGTFFCSVSTPDTYVLFLKKLALYYEEQGLSAEEAKAKAEKNLCMRELPARMPKDGDLSKDAATMSDDDFVDTVVMGGVNGYAISAYTKYREAAQAFVNFATSYDMIKLRMDMLGIAPTRSDVAKESGGTTEMIFESLADGRIYLMPSIKALNQVWTPVHTLLSDIAKDAFRKDQGEIVKYPTEELLQTALDEICTDIYNSIFTMAE